MKYLLHVVILGLICSGTTATAQEDAKTALPPISEDIRVGTDALRQTLTMFNVFGTNEAADSETAQRLTQILQQLAPVSDLPSLPYEVHVIPSEISNAACLPGGKLLIFSGIWGKKDGMIRKERDDEVAAILAHEMAHAAKRHWARERSGQETLRSYEYEIEADRRGMVYMARAGYNPKAMVRIFGREIIKAQRKPSAKERRFARVSHEWQRAFASHPTHERRTQDLRRNLRDAMIIYRVVAKAKTEPKRGTNQNPTRMARNRYQNRYTG